MLMTGNQTHENKNRSKMLMTASTGHPDIANNKIATTTRPEDSPVPSVSSHGCLVHNSRTPMRGVHIQNRVVVTSRLVIVF